MIFSRSDLGSNRAQPNRRLDFPSPLNSLQSLRHVFRRQASLVRRAYPNSRTVIPENSRNFPRFLDTDCVQVLQVPVIFLRPPKRSALPPRIRSGAVHMLNSNVQISFRTCTSRNSKFTSQRQRYGTTHGLPTCPSLSKTHSETFFRSSRLPMTTSAP